MSESVEASALPNGQSSSRERTFPDINTRNVLDYLHSTGLSSEITEAEQTQFVSVCQAFGLNPWKREVYATVYGEGSSRRFSVITGFETYLKRGERTGRLDGWSSHIEGKGPSMKAVVEIHRKDWSQPLVHEAYFVEAVQKKKDGTPTSFWQKMPRLMLKKVGISQAFRMAFADELGGLPFTTDELPDAEALAAAPSVSAPPSPLPASPSATAPSSDASSAQGELSPGPEAIPSPAPQPSAAPTIRFLGYQDPYPEEPQDALLVRLEHYLDDNYTAFTERHRDWIFEKAKHSRDRHGVLKMLSYSEKVVKNISAVAGASA